MSDWLVLTGRTLVLKENMKTLIFFYFYTRSMLKVGFLCLLLLSAAKGQPGYTITDLGTLGGSFSQATAINNPGQIVGSSVNVGNPHAFLYSGGHMFDLGTLGGSESTAHGINNRGQIVGESLTSGDAVTHAFLYSGGQMRDLGTLGGSYSQAFAINDPGQIVGLSSLVIGPKKPSHAFLYSGGQMQDLNNLLPSNSGWIVTQAVSINDAGQIACSGSNGQATHALLLTPVSQYTKSEIGGRLGSLAISPHLNSDGSNFATALMSLKLTSLNNSLSEQ